MRNDLIELIAYDPQTPKVHARPMLFSPPWINKYYIMDLSPGRSFVEWAVKHGHQVFAISYRNPDATMAHYKMDDYLREGFLAALDAVQEITGAKQVNVAALCLGGTLALIGLAYLAAHGQGDRIGSATVTNTLIDFSIPGDLGIFTDEDTIARLEQRMRERGYLDSAEMAKTFDWMRSQDLIWSYVVNSWFKGKPPPAFDILAWNGDSTRMPVEMHSQYLRACYLHNALVKPGAFRIDDTPIDLGRILTPLYVLGAENDHIAPWHATYLTTQHVGGEAKYMLTNSGHIAGIVNPPGGKKSLYYTKPVAASGESADEWLATRRPLGRKLVGGLGGWAETHGGDWSSRYACPTGEPAPGRYVRNETATAVCAGVAGHVSDEKSEAERTSGSAWGSLGRIHSQPARAREPFDAPARRDREDLQPLPQPGGTWAVQTFGRRPQADCGGAAYFGGDDVRPGRPARQLAERTRITTASSTQLSSTRA